MTSLDHLFSDSTESEKRHPKSKPDVSVLLRVMKEESVEEDWLQFMVNETPEIQKKYISERKAEARDEYFRLMRSSKNNGSDAYARSCAIRAVTSRSNIEPHGYTAQPIGGKNWRGWKSKS